MTEESYWQRAAKQRWPRRAFLKGAGALAAGAAGASVVGCGGGEEEGAPQATPPSADGTPRPGHRLQIAVAMNFISIDPHLTVGSGFAIVSWVYGYLFHYSGTLPEEMLWDMAEEMERPDDLTYRLSLRRGVRTPPDGPLVPERELTSEDVVATMERIRDLPGATAGVFLKQRVESFEAPDPWTVVVKTKEPYAWTLDSLGSPVGGAIIPKPLIEAGTDLRTQGAGSGPFFLEHYRDGEIASVTRNVNFWGAPRPWIDGIDFRIIMDRAARRTAFLSQQIDMYDLDTIREAEEVERMNDRIVITSEPSLYTWSLGMQADREPFNDERVRRAIALGLNRQDFIDKLAFGEGKPNGPVAWSLDFWALDQEEVKRLQPYDPEEARSLLQAAGYGDGLKLPTVHPDDQATTDHVTILLEQMSAIGVGLELQPLPLTAWYFDRYQTGNFTFTVAANLPYESPSTPLNFFHSDGVQGDGNWHGFSDPEVDAAIDEMNRTLDLDERADLCREAQRLIISKDPPMLHVFSEYSYGARWDYVKGTKPEMRSLALYNRDFWLDK
ncbi:MAG: ABC transporter substrate-binding protein [Dehalococcoidia bacterium]